MVTSSFSRKSSTGIRIRQEKTEIRSYSSCRPTNITTQKTSTPRKTVQTHYTNTTGCNGSTITPNLNPKLPLTTTPESKHALNPLIQHSPFTRQMIRQRPTNLTHTHTTHSRYPPLDRHPLNRFTRKSQRRHNIHPRMTTQNTRHHHKPQRRYIPPAIHHKHYLT